MLRQIVPVCIYLAVGWMLFVGASRRSRAQEPQESPSEDRVATARANVEQTIRALFTKNEIAYPPGQLFIRAFKTEEILEVWAGNRDSALHLIKQYPLTAKSGDLGPKRREGDKQIPEGCYVIDRFNPKSLFHLSMGVDYPNASDRLLSDQEKPGKDIFIHGRAKSVGCLAIGDPGIEEVYVMAADYAAQNPAPIAVHIFPGRFDSAAWAATANQATTKKAGLAMFWDDLRPIYLSFEQSRRIPVVDVVADGRYQLRDKTASAH